MEQTILLALTLLTPVLLLSLRVIFTNRRTSTQKALPYPPGPPANLLWGNALQISQKGLAQVFRRWGKEYQSDILHASAFGKHIIVLTTRSLAEELLEGRAALYMYSDRPHFPVVELMGWDFLLVFMNYTNHWRQQRKICQQNFHKSADQRCWPVQLELTHEFLRSLADKPERVWEHIQTLSFSLGLSTMYAYKPANLDDPIIKANDQLIALGASLLSAWGQLRPLRVCCRTYAGTSHHEAGAVRQENDGEYEKDTEGLC